MTQRLFITIGSHHRKDRLLLEVPGDKKVQSMAPDLVKILGWKELEGIPSGQLALESEDGTLLPPSQSLQDFGASTSDFFFLVTKPHTVTESVSTTVGGLAVTETGREPIAAPQDQDTGCSIPSLLKQPHFLSPSGIVLIIGATPLLIGRTGSNISPAIDLSEWDANIIASRKHALLEHHNDTFLLKPQNTTNGTFVNNIEVPTGSEIPLKDGDRVQFGFQGVELLFRQSAE